MALQDSLDQLKDFEMSDLDVNNIGAWPSVIKGILLFIILVAVLGGGYYFYLTDKQNSLASVVAKEIELKKDYEDKSERAANLEEYREQKNQMEATFGALLRQLPSDTEVPGLIEDITRAALDNELRIDSINLKNEIQTEFYVELPIDIVVEGDYHKLGSFVSAVASLSRIVTLHNFNVAPQGSATNLKMSITAKTYRYLDDEG